MLLVRKELSDEVFNRDHRLIFMDHTYTTQAVYALLSSLHTEAHKTFQLCTTETEIPLLPLLSQPQSCAGAQGWEALLISYANLPGYLDVIRIKDELKLKKCLL